MRRILVALAVVGVLITTAVDPALLPPLLILGGLVYIVLPRRRQAGEPATVVMARARQHRLLFVGLGFIGGGLGFIVLAIVFEWLRGGRSFVSDVVFIGGVFFLPVGLSSWALALFFRFRFLRGQVGDAIEATGGDEGSRVLYLRSFEQDAEWGVYLPFIVWNPMSWRMLARPVGLLRAYALIFTGRLTFEQVLKAATPARWGS